MTDETIYPKSWESIVEKHSDYMANENPEHGWYYRNCLENLAEDLWENVTEDSN